MFERAPVMHFAVSGGSRLSRARVIEMTGSDGSGEAFSTSDVCTGERNKAFVRVHWRSPRLTPVSSSSDSTGHLSCNEPLDVLLVLIQA
jgi:hypothetical protein